MDKKSGTTRYDNPSQSIITSVDFLSGNDSWFFVRPQLRTNVSMNKTKSYNHSVISHITIFAPNLCATVSHPIPQTADAFIFMRRILLAAETLRSTPASSR
jgi:hypothetical protein